MEKPVSEMNADLIDECVDWSLELDGRQVKIPQENIKKITKSIVSQHYISKKKKFFNGLMIIAACVALIFSIQFVSLTVFHEDLFHDVYDGAVYIYDEVQHIIYHVTHPDDTGHDHVFHK